MHRLFLCLVLLSAAVARAETLRIAAAADLRFALEEVVAAQPGEKAQATYASSGTLFAQIKNGAPFDLFLSADSKFPRQLIERGAAEAESFFVYAHGHLAVWTPRGSKLDFTAAGLRALLTPEVRKVAIANPEVAPYGAAAVAALEKAGVYAELKSRLVLGENVAQTAQFVQTGGADAGIISLSLALAPKMKADGQYWEVPLDHFPKLEQAGVICRRGANRAGAQAFVDFLRGAAGRAILARHGFTLPADPH